MHGAKYAHRSHAYEWRISCAGTCVLGLHTRVVHWKPPPPPRPHSTICKEWSSTLLPSTARSTWAGNHFSGSGSTTVPMRFDFGFMCPWTWGRGAARRRNVGMHTVLCGRAGFKNNLQFTGWQLIVQESGHVIQENSVGKIQVHNQGFWYWVKLIWPDSTNTE